MFRKVTVRRAISAVIACLMCVCGCFRLEKVWSFSMLLEERFLCVQHHAYGGLNLIGVDGAEILD